MKSSITPFIAILLAMSLTLGACKKGENTSGEEVTETIAPASPQPAPTGTDAMTQTVDIEGGRTDAEGGVLATPGTAGDTAVTSGATTTTTTATAAPATTTKQE